jgi:hypothetical protein
VLTNTAAAFVFALAVVLASRELAHEVLAAQLLEYAVAIVAAWVLTLGAPSRYVSFAAPDAEVFARAVWQTVIAATVLGGLLAAVAWSAAGSAAGDKLRSFVIVLGPVLAAYIGREVSNVAFGRAQTSVQCLAQTLAGSALAVSGWWAGWWSGNTAFHVFLIAHYSNGALQLLVYLVLHRPTIADLQMPYLRESGRTNLALGFGTLLLGNFDKLALAFRPALGGLDSAYLIADRLTSAYGTVMNYYTQSRVQRAIERQSWTGQPAVRVIDAWFRRALPGVVLFILLGGVGMALAGPLLRMDIQAWLAGLFVLAICTTFHLKNSSGYAIRLLDSVRARERFNTIALALVGAALVSLALCLRAGIEVIVAVKLALHAVMLQMLRQAARQLETRS